MSTRRDTEKWSNQMESIVDDMREREAEDRLHPTAGSVVIAQCDTCRDMAEFPRDELPTACGWTGCNGTVMEKINPPNDKTQTPT